MRIPNVAFYPAHGSNYTKGRVRPIRIITIHHTAANNTTLRHLYASPARNGSAHFFVSDKVIEQYVDTNDTAWTNGWYLSNAEAITIEVNGDWRFGYHNQATLNKLQSLLFALRKAYPSAVLTYHMDERRRNPDGKTTLCPADLKHKGYAKQVWDKVTAQLTPPKPAPTPKITYKKITPKRVELKVPANLWNFNFTKWSDAKSVASYPAGHIVDVVAEATNSLGAKYYMTAYSYNNGKIRATNGFNVADTKPHVIKPVPPPTPTDPPVVEPPIKTDPNTPSDSDVEKRLNAIEALLKTITDFLDKIFKWR